MRGLLVIAVLAACAAVPPLTNETKKPINESITGCVDEMNARCVLIRELDLRRAASFEPAFHTSEDMMAQHIGHNLKGLEKFSQAAAYPALMAESAGISPG